MASARCSDCGRSLAFANAWNSWWSDFGMVVESTEGSSGCLGRPRPRFFATSERIPLASSYPASRPFEVPRCLTSHGAVRCAATAPCDPPMIASLRPILLLTLAVQAAIAQRPQPLRLTPSGPVLPDEHQLRATIGKEVDRLLPDVLAQWLSRSNAESVNVIAEQIPVAWLPSNVRFTRIPLEVAKRGWAEDCLKLLWLTSDLKADSLLVTVSRGNRCATLRSDDVFDWTPDGWRRRSGVGSGGGSGVGDCGCKLE